MPSVGDGEDLGLARPWSERKGGRGIRAIFGVFRLDHILAPFSTSWSLLVAMLMHASLTASTLIRMPQTTGMPLVTGEAGLRPRMAVPNSELRRIFSACVGGRRDGLQPSNPDPAL